MSKYIELDALMKTLDIKEDCLDCNGFVKGGLCARGGAFVDVCEAIFDAPTIDIPTWIPCSERLPEERDRIIVQSADGRWALMPSVRMRVWEIMAKYNEFVAWMPIEPYREKNDE